MSVLPDDQRIFESLIQRIPGSNTHFKISFSISKNNFPFLKHLCRPRTRWMETLITGTQMEFKLLEHGLNQWELQHHLSWYDQTAHYQVKVLAQIRHGLTPCLTSNGRGPLSAWQIWWDIGFSCVNAVASGSDSGWIAVSWTFLFPQPLAWDNNIFRSFHPSFAKIVFLCGGNGQTHYLGSHFFTRWYFYLVWHLCFHERIMCPLCLH